MTKTPKIRVYDSTKHEENVTSIIYHRIRLLHMMVLELRASRHCWSSPLGIYVSYTRIGEPVDADIKSLCLKRLQDLLTQGTNQK
jgi:hypothetical protein